MAIGNDVPDNKDENFDLWHKRGFTKGARVVMHREPWNIVWCLPLWAAIFKPITKFGAIWQSSLKEGGEGVEARDQALFRIGRWK